MDFFKKTKDRIAKSFAQVLNLGTSQEAIARHRNPKGSLSDRLIRRYASVSEEKEQEPSLATTLFGKLRLRRTSSLDSKSKRFIEISKRLSEEDLETNKKRLGALGEFLDLFQDDGEDYQSDQDSFIEDLQDIGYILTPKLTDMRKEMKTDRNDHSKLGDDVFRTVARGTKCAVNVTDDAVNKKGSESDIKDNHSGFTKSNKRRY